MGETRRYSDGNLSPTSPGDEREFEVDYTSTGPEPQPGVGGAPVRCKLAIVINILLSLKITHSQGMT
jgi:hypothetical protein